MTSTRRKRLLSGMRPTGRLHLGNLVGALENWVAMQESYESFHLVADYHALTTNPDSSGIAHETREMVMDWLAAGIDPARSPIFRQSHVKEHAELYLILSMLITTARLERNPTLKEQMRELRGKGAPARAEMLEFVAEAGTIDPAAASPEERETALSLGHLAYPVLQAADVMLYKGEVVPVGEDQLPHLEITRELARRFNAQYAPVFPEPEPRLTAFARLPGLDRNKMSKSLGNAILMSDPPAVVQQKLRGAITDELKVRKNDPGRPDVCLIFTYHKKFNPEAVPAIDRDCRSGALGCVECKKMVGERINAHLAPMLERREALAAAPRRVDEALEAGEVRARREAAATMNHVHEAMHLG